MNTGCLDGGGKGVGKGCTYKEGKRTFVSLFLKTRILNYPVSAVAHPSSCGQPSRQSWRRGTTMRRLPAGITSAASSTIADATTCTLVRLTAGKSECCRELLGSCRMLLGKCVPGNIYTLIYYLFIIQATFGRALQPRQTPTTSRGVAGDFVGKTRQEPTFKINAVTFDLDKVM